MEMHQIRYFFAFWWLIEELEFHPSGQARCQVSQPALTRAIRKLEEEFRRSFVSPLNVRQHPYFRTRSHGAAVSQAGSIKVPKAPSRRPKTSSDCTRRRCDLA